MNTNNSVELLHNEAIKIVADYKRCEISLIEILEKVDAHKVYYSKGHSSLFAYATDGLGLSPEVAYIFINVSRKTKQVPALKEEIRKGTITVSKAKKITSVLTSENQDHWLEVAKTSTQKQIEKHVASVSPDGGIRERLSYVSHFNEIAEKAQIKQSSPTSARIQLQVGLSEQCMLKLRRAQDVLSQKRKAPVSLEELINTMTEHFLQKEDPLKKAERQKIKGKLNAPAPASLETDSSDEQVLRLVDAEKRGNTNNIIKRKPLPSAIKHRLHLKYNSQCAFANENGKRCTQRRHLEIHHLIPIAQGGTDELSNLTLLCAGHHKAIHLDTNTELRDASRGQWLT